MTGYDHLTEEDVAKLAYLRELVTRVQELRANSVAALKSATAPNFVMAEPILPSPLLIPHPSESAPPMSWRKMVAGSAGAAVTVVCLSIVVLSLVHTP